MEDYGVKITLPGYDVTDTNIQHYVLHSKYQTMKTYIVGTGSIYFSNETYAHQDHTIVSVSHNLGYKPYCTMFWALSDGTGGGDIWLTGSGDFFAYVYWDVGSSDFHIYYTQYGSHDSGLSGKTLDFKYYIFINQGMQ